MTRQSRWRRARPVFDYRPDLLELENRRAPGDTVIGAVLFGASLGMDFLWSNEVPQQLDVGVTERSVDEIVLADAPEFDFKYPPAADEIWVTENTVVRDNSQNDHRVVIENAYLDDALVSVLDVNHLSSADFLNVGPASNGRFHHASADGDNTADDATAVDSAAPFSLNPTQLCYTFRSDRHAAV